MFDYAEPAFDYAGRIRRFQENLAGEADLAFLAHLGRSALSGWHPARYSQLRGGLAPGRLDGGRLVDAARQARRSRSRA